MSLSSVMQITFHGHKGRDLDAEVDITGFVHSVSFSHALTPPWEAMTIGMQLPVQLWQNVLAGVPRADGRIPKPGFWVVVWLYPTGNSAIATKAGGRTAIAWGYVDKVQSGFTHHDNGQQTTMPMHVSCISWLALVGRSTLSLAAPESSAGREGFVYNLNTWDEALLQVLSAVTEKQPGKVLQKLFAETVRIYFPTTLTGSTTRDFGQDIPVVWDQASASKYAPTRAATVQPIQGQAVHSAAYALPDKTSLLSWLYAIFVCDQNMIEMFPSLEYPKQGPDGSVTSATQAARALGGAQPVLVYRIRPFNLTAIDAAAMRAADLKDGYGPTGNYTSTASQKAGLYQTPVSAKDHGFGDPFYDIPADEVLAVEDITWDDSNRVNLAFVNNIFTDTGPIQAYDIVTAPVVQDLNEFNRYGQRAFRVNWSFVPPVQGQDVPPNQSSASLRVALDAVSELAWTLTGGVEQTCTGRVKTLFVPWRKAGHWFSAELRLQQGNASTRVAYLTGYIEQVTHSARVVNPETGHVEMDTIVHFTRGLLSDKPGEFFWTAAGVETRAKRTPKDSGRQETASSQSATGSSSVPSSAASTAVPKVDIAQAEARIREGQVWGANVPSTPLAVGDKFLMTPGVPAGEVLDTPAKQAAALAKLRAAAAAVRKQTTRPPRGAPTPKFSKFPSSLSKNKQTATQPSKLTIFTLNKTPFQEIGYSPRGNNRIRAIGIHHTAIDSLNSPAVLHGLNAQTTYVNSRGETVAYSKSTHFLIEGDGTVFMLLNPDLWTANHCGRTALNRQSIGIDFGGKLTNSPTLPEAQFMAGRLLIDYLLRRYGLPVKVVSPTLRSTYNGSTRPGTNPVDINQLLDAQYTVFRHYNVKATACPGKTPVEQLATPVDWQYSVEFVAT